MSSLPSPAVSIAQAVRSGGLPMTQPANEALARIRAASSLNAVLSEVDPSEQLQALEGRLGSGEALPLAGVPVIIKDNLNLRGTVTSCASGMLAEYRSPYTATAVQRLMDAGAVIVAKANLDEFAMGSSTENSAFGPTLNPWGEGRVPGGSSGGSAAAIAARLAPLTVGSDTGGSVRQPAALCGVYGLKPTYGRISRSGLVAYASSLDTVAPFALSAADLALMMGVMSGQDPLDATSLQTSADFSAEPLDLAGLRVGLVTQGKRGATLGVLSALEAMQTTLETAGAEVEETSLPHLDNAVATYYVIAMAEASSNLSRFDGMHYARRTGEGGATETMIQSRETFLGAEVQKRIMLGTFILSSGYSERYYTKALQVRRLIADEFTQAFERFDVLLMPTSPFPAFRLGERSGDPLAMYAADVNTVAVNLAGIPALNVPAGFEELDGQRLPVGLQFAARAGDDTRLVALAATLEGLGAVQLEVPLGYQEFGV
ncbi:Asp-tRNA(Asn)/Glu-tRNA(Gln) amidotransferase subunit GatA [Deinococcus radiophilus]|uniref:Glutamyl-tRNA(Gln) amidotransferase subunit A n=1 Tax=Deinococcus radiophilus TaxID=32062 RepID=A0A3S0L172_9DEIO|nr:Asp-tRNA(Asn)/Glu-tRNA(Gln) amidotransferase subunit GatA [Deinococcus radiophilus]RTR23821.1 Asp-tRNA(Asn)/Glu-tRNA(Gln) amidotransferase subunit GatA [Deinococcus radiophilus]UFA50463.1 Asp-tRNA(Asn)/Glu-tRNA(Gln) amidotransferase subunit GatA [Deinococcus radiophilus]